MSDKPKLTLLSRKSAFDVEALVKLFEKLTGRKPTQAEIEAAREELKQGSN